MTTDDLKYDFEERVAIMLENGATELQAIQQARREVRDKLKVGGLDIAEANKVVMQIEKGIYG